MKNIMKSVTVALAVCATSLAVSASAQVVISESQGLGSLWVTNATQAISATPVSSYASAENGWPAGAGFGETFVAKSSGTLSNIQMYVSGGDSVYLAYLYDLGPASGFTGYSAGFAPGLATTLTNLVPSGNLITAGTTFEYFGGASLGVMMLKFSGDAITVNAGDLYYWRLNLQSGTVMTWERSGSDVYSDGSAYKANSTTSFNAGGRDFSLDVFVNPVPEPSTVALLSLAGGVALMGWRRRRSA
jgi:hypothetical protein